MSAARAAPKRRNKKKASRLRKAIMAPYECLGINQPLTDCTVIDLQRLCGLRGLKKAGRKNVIIARLTKVLETERKQKNAEETQRVKPWEKVKLNELISLVEHSEVSTLSADFKDGLDAGAVRTRKLLKLMKTVCFVLYYIPARDEKRKMMDADMMNHLLCYDGKKCGFRESIYCDNAPVRQSMANIPRRSEYRHLGLSAGPAMKALLKPLIDKGLINLASKPPPGAVKVDADGQVIEEEEVEDEDMEEEDEEKVDLNGRRGGHDKFIIIRNDPWVFYNRLSDEKKVEYKAWISQRRINLTNYYMQHFNAAAMNKAHEAGLIEGWQPQNEIVNYSEDEMRILALLG